MNFFKQQEALKYRNYRLYLSGQSLSVIGTWMQRIAMIWLVYRLSDSAFLLGMVGFCEQFPIFLIAPFAGVYADRTNKHKAIILLQTLLSLQALVLAILTFTQVIQVWHILVLSVVLGLITSFDITVRQAFVINMIDEDKKALGNAIALNSTVFNVSRLIGPAIAGIIIAFIGEGWCFMTNAVSFFAVIFSLTAMRVKAKPVSQIKEKILPRLKEGFRYVFSSLPMRSVILLLALTSLMSSAINILSPVFAKKILHGDADTLGFLMSAAGVGAIIGAIYLTKKRSVGFLIRGLGYSAAIFGIGMILFGISKNLLLSLALILVTGLCQIIQLAGSNTLLQTITSDDKRGRVMGLYTIGFRGVRPFGSLLAGGLATFLGAPWTMVLMGAACIAAACLYMKAIKT